MVFEGRPEGGWAGAAGSDSSIQVIIDFVTRGIEKVKKSFRELTKSSQEINKSQQLARDTIKKFAEQIKDTEKTTGVFDKLSESSRKLNMSLLGAMFFAMKLSKAFSGLRKNIMDTYFAGELLNIQFTLMSAMSPLLDPFVDMIYMLIDAFLSLPEPVLMTIGILGAFIGIFAGLIVIVISAFFAINGLIVVAEFLGMTVGALIATLGGVAAAILGVIIIGVLLYKHWDTIKEKFDELLEKFKKTDLYGTLKEKFEKIKEKISELMEKIKEKIKNSGIYKFFKGVWDKVVEITGKVLGEIIPRVKKIWDSLKGIWESTWNFIKEFLKTTWENVIKPVIELIAAIISKLIEKLVGWFKPKWEWVWDKIKTAIEWAKDKINKIIGKIKEKIEWLKDKFQIIKDKIKNIMEKLGEKIEWVWDNLIKPPLDKFIEGLEEIKTVYENTLGWILEQFKGGTKTFKMDIEATTERVKEFQHGGMVKETGLAYLHQGEYVVPKSQVNNMNMSPTININIEGGAGTGADMETLSNRIMDRLLMELRSMRL